MTRAWVGAGVVALLLCGGPTAGSRAGVPLERASPGVRHRAAVHRGDHSPRPGPGGRACLLERHPAARRLGGGHRRGAPSPVAGRSGRGDRTRGARARPRASRRRARLHRDQGGPPGPRNARPHEAGHLGPGHSPPGGGVLRHLLQDGDERRAIRDRHVHQNSLDTPSRRSGLADELHHDGQGRDRAQAGDVDGGALLGPTSHGEPERGERRVAGPLFPLLRPARPGDPPRPGLLAPRRLVHRRRPPAGRGDQSRLGHAAAQPRACRR